MTGYWESRYRNGGDSGAGSRGSTAELKADHVNGLIRAHDVRSVLDIGSGDGQVARRLRVHSYVGVEVSRAARRLASRRCKGDPDKRFVPLSDPVARRPAELHLSLDVIFHLVRERDFRGHLRLLFSAIRFVVVVSSDVDLAGAKHVRHRRWTHLVPDGWRLLDRRPFPVDDSLTEDYRYEKRLWTFGRA